MREAPPRIGLPLRDDLADSTPEPPFDIPLFAILGVASRTVSMPVQETLLGDHHPVRPLPAPATPHTSAPAGLVGQLSQSVDLILVIGFTGAHAPRKSGVV